jgi:quinohemoprotein ethanol dehydrogenase
VGGKQYVTVLTGLGTTMGVWGPILDKYDVDPRSQRRRVLTFVLDGKARLPADTRPHPEFAKDPDFKSNPESARAGAPIYYAHCLLCHGMALVSGTHAPDLRRSDVPASAEAFAAVVRDGALEAGGMPRFAEFTDRQLEDLRQYIRTGTRDAREHAGRSGK